MDPDHIGDAALPRELISRDLQHELDIRARIGSSGKLDYDAAFCQRCVEPDRGGRPRGPEQNWTADSDREIVRLLLQAKLR